MTDRATQTWYEVATVSRIDKIICLFFKRAPQKRQYSAKETYNFIDPTNQSQASVSEMQGLVYRCIGLFCGYIGLFCGYIALFCGYVGLFCNTRLYYLAGDGGCCGFTCVTCVAQEPHRYVLQKSFITHTHTYKHPRSF